ncbi:MAG: type II secretion system F family protein [Candidatus Omnitrophica bacterium]|nr:type II secretion system F family protein [Candidatus Omnitrophota bacterium]
MYWEYVVLNNFGTQTTGIGQGSIKEIKEMISGRHWTLISMRPNFLLHVREQMSIRQIDHKTLADLLNNFAGMLQVGLSMNEIIENLEDTTNSIRVKTALRNMRQDLNKGYPLWEAMDRTTAFPSTAICCIAAGEQSGNLPEVLRSLAETFAFSDEVQKRVGAAIAYPIGLIVLISGAALIISLKLVPALRDFLPEASMKSWSVKMFLFYCDLVQYHWYLFLLVPIILFMILVYCRRHYEEQFLKYLYKVPVLGSFIKEMQLSLYFLNLYTYQKSGITIKESILSINNVQNSYISRIFLRCRKGIDQGLCFWEAVKKEKEIPRIVHQNIHQGEIQGKYDEYFRNIYLYFKNRTEDSARNLIPMLQPVFIVVAGGMIIFLVSTFIVPIYTNLNGMMENMF